MNTKSWKTVAAYNIRFLLLHLLSQCMWWANFWI